MRLENKVVLADAGKWLSRKKKCLFRDDFGKAFTMLKGETEDDFVEVDVLPDPRPEEGQSYKARVQARVKSDLGLELADEIAIIRQRDASPEKKAEFDKYFADVERIKDEERAK